MRALVGACANKSINSGRTTSQRSALELSKSIASDPGPLPAANTTSSIYGNRRRSLSTAQYSEFLSSTTGLPGDASFNLKGPQPTTCSGLLLRPKAALKELFRT